MFMFESREVCRRSSTSFRRCEPNGYGAQQRQGRPKASSDVRCNDEMDSSLDAIGIWSATVVGLMSACSLERRSPGTSLHPGWGANRSSKLIGELTTKLEERRLSL